MALENLNFERSLKTLKVQWNDNDHFGRYNFFYFLTIGITASLWSLIRRHIEFGNNFQSYLPDILTFILISILFIVSCRAYTVNENITRIKTKKSVKEIRESIENQSKLSGYKIIRSNNKYLLLEKQGKWLVGTRIVLLFHHGFIYVNIQNSFSYRGYFPFSFGRNQQIKLKIIDEVKLL